MSSLAAVGQAEASNAISVAVAKKALDAAKRDGAAAIELIKSAASVQYSAVDADGRLDAIA
ncbi:MAG: hypothetical protein H7Y88_06220 [Phycisphaerales bacterium]|nr:hypothetical protein [Phycisphaerales bacterium]